MPLMSSQASTRAYGVLPRTPVSEIRTRKWTKQPKNIGHLTILKWIPGRKRGAGEVGRMTRSVRQHMAAPLELLSEYPVRVLSSRQSSPSRNAVDLNPSERTHLSTPYSDATIAASKQSRSNPHASTYIKKTAKQEHTAGMSIDPMSSLPTRNYALDAGAAKTARAAPDSTLQVVQMIQPVSTHMMNVVPSDEQLEMALDDLPMLDADDSFNLDALDPAFLPTPLATAAPPPKVQPYNNTYLRQHSVDNSSVSVSEDEGSANSGSPMPSASPHSSPEMMSRSTSP
ncbi:uncharacterized protein CCR75_008300 [Bremia lactucae]|uniref:Uncharacterized protein n=1 Tax=Bremia lactucae TaxID=4779 RepID=A0A976NYS3_BRELC|nr:hypothetical protein CCR75_008300 [Bremia lactucae]